jgi:hypothetical protein
MTSPKSLTLAFLLVLIAGCSSPAEREQSCVLSDILGINLAARALNWRYNTLVRWCPLGGLREEGLVMNKCSWLATLASLVAMACGGNSDNDLIRR